MTYLVPNYFLEKQPNAVISSDSLFTLAYATRKNNHNFMIRNTTHVMILVMEGSKKITYKNEVSLLKKGDILLLTQGNYTMSETLSNQGKYEALLVYFNDDFMMNFLQKYSIETNNFEQNSFVSFHSDGLLKLLIDSFSLYISHDLERKNEILQLKTQELFLHLMSEHPQKFGSFLKAISDSSPHRVAYILESNLDIIESVEDMCRIARVSKNELRKAIDKYASLSPKAWLDAKRLKEASFLLRTTDEPIASIATTCGYSTLSWFGVQFKKAYGVSPKVYREQNR